MNRHQRELNALKAENAALREQLYEQWAANHAEHCGWAWPHPDHDNLCGWPMLDDLATSERFRTRRVA